MGHPLIACELPIEDRRLLATARHSHLRGVLIRDGQIEAPRTPRGIPDELSVSALALEMDQRLVIAAESVDVGPKAEAFRLRVFGESDSFSVAVREGLRAPARGHAEMELAAISREDVHPALLRFKSQMVVELVLGSESQVDVISDSGLILVASSGAILLVEHDQEVPLNLRLTTSSRRIEEALLRATELVLL